MKNTTAIPTRPPGRDAHGMRHRRLRLVAVSFIALFLELLLIRWAPSVVRLIAYYGNLLLISSFLGLGIGAMLANHRFRLFGWFPALLAAEIAVIYTSRHFAFSGTGGELRFFTTSAPHLAAYAILIGIFAANSLTFVPLGQEIGRLFQTMPALSAYTWDISGSLAGTITFGLFSFNSFSPIIGMMVVCVAFVVLTHARGRAYALLVFASLLAVMHAAEDSRSTWSPYYYVTVRRAVPADVQSMARPTVVDAPANALRTMTNPPMYLVFVNQDFYQFHGTINEARYRGESPAAEMATVLRDQYLLPYSLCAGRKRVAILGSGGGLDVEAALLSGVAHVDAAEIDPRLVGLSKSLNASGVYDDARVSVEVDDARAFVRRASGGYDFVVFSYLDSQALFSYMTNVRLDGFVYTVESLKSAYSLVADDGAMVLSFGTPQPWVAEKLLRMVIDATGRVPIVYFDGAGIMLISPRGAHANPPARWGRFVRVPVSPDVDDAPRIEAATDDWPYLYLNRRMIPYDYVVVIGILVALSLGSIVAVRGRSVDLNDCHFACLGMGFLLLETKAIGDSSLYFGATWLVTMIVVSGVLVMTLAANAVASRIQRFSPVLYAPLLAALVVLYFMPRESILIMGFWGRVAWTLLLVPLPVFFAGLIFSTTFRESVHPSLVLGANLIGGMLGGFSEYLSMIVGSHTLTLLVVAAYLGSLFCRTRLAEPLSSTAAAVRA